MIDYPVTMVYQVFRLVSFNLRVLLDVHSCDHFFAADPIIRALCTVGLQPMKFNTSRIIISFERIEPLRGRAHSVLGISLLTGSQQQGVVYRRTILTAPVRGISVRR